MRYGIELVPFGEFANPRAAIDLALAAERAGWDGFFTWDHAAFVEGMASGEAFVTLAAVAAVTSRLRLGTFVTALPRRGPHLVAHALAALDQLSQGRLIFSAGAGGVEREFTAFGQPGDIATRAVMLDEGLEVLDRLLRGQTVDHVGRHYVIDGVTLSPAPVQQPRPPIWAGGMSRAGMRRAARWDGWAASIAQPDGSMSRTPEQFADDVAYLVAHRDRGEEGFEVTVDGVTAPGDATLPRAYAAAGATWWLEAIHGMRGSREDLLRRIDAGPPR